MPDTRLSIRLDLPSGDRIGPGKIALLEAIQASGSISAAARKLDMSYRRAWLLVEQINQPCRNRRSRLRPAAVRAAGPLLTPSGERVIELYRSIEDIARSSAKEEFRAVGQPGAEEAGARLRHCADAVVWRRCETAWDISGGSRGCVRRSKIWELADTLHCSIIGTCLSNAELRHALARLGVNGIEVADDHELHVVGVMLAGRRDAGAKMLQRALDRRHATGDQAIWQSQGRGGVAPVVGRVDAQRRHPGRILGAPESSGRHRDDREEGVPGRAHAVASRRRRQSSGHPPAAATGAGERRADREAASAAAAVARRFHLPRRNDPPAQQRCWRAHHSREGSGANREAARRMRPRERSRPET